MTVVLPLLRVERRANTASEGSTFHHKTLAAAYEETPGCRALGLAEASTGCLLACEPAQPGLVDELELLAAISGDLVKSQGQGPLGEFLQAGISADDEAFRPGFEEALVFGVDEIQIFVRTAGSSGAVLIAVCSADENLALAISTVRHFACQIT